MKLQPPLMNLVSRCQTICVSECCGIEAYDFSPIQIASFLTMHTGLPEKEELEKIHLQLRILRESIDESDGKLSIEDMNQTFTPEDLDTLIKEIEGNIEVALDLIKTSEKRRTKSGEPVSGHNSGGCAPSA